MPPNKAIGVTPTKLESVNSWTQLIAAVAVVAGLIIVIYELRQNREATMSQLTNEGYHFSSQVGISTLGEEPGIALAKACFHPEDLTESDLFVLDSLYSQRIFTLDRLINLSSRGTFYSPDYWQAVADIQFDLIFRTQVGRNYWKLFKSNQRPEIQRYGDSRLKEAGAPNCEQLFSLWMDANSNDGTSSGERVVTDT